MQQDQPTRVGRRLAAIVAADVAGYSRLMGLDEVGRAHTLRDHREVTDALVEKHGRRLVSARGGLLEFSRWRCAHRAHRALQVVARCGSNGMAAKLICAGFTAFSRVALRLPLGSAKLNCINGLFSGWPGRLARVVCR